MKLISKIITGIRRHILSVLLVVGVLFLALSFEAGRWSVYRAHPDLSANEQVQEVLGKVGKLIQLPSETPTMAAIQDAASAKQGQPFLANAQNGDVLIVYANAAEALLYRPSTDKLIAVGPVNTNTPSSMSQNTTVSATPAIPTDNATTTKKKK